MPASDAEIEALRYHLGYGNIGVGAYPYTPDGFKELFEEVVGPAITEGAETTSGTAVAAAGIVTITPVAMVGIVPYARLVVDVGDDAETITVQSTTLTTFAARFTKAHTGTGWPIAVESGLTRLRALLYQAARAESEIVGTSTSETAGLKSVGRGAIEWHPGGAVLTEKVTQYVTIIDRLSSLVRVEPLRHLRRATRLEAY